MNRRFLAAVLSMFAGGALLIGLLHWHSAQYDTADVTEQDIVKARLELQGHLTAPKQSTVLEALDMKRPVRLVIGSVGLGEGDKNQSVGDLTLASLSGAPGLELVDRQSLEKILRETELSLSGLVRAKDAVKVGKLLRADWVLLGSEIKFAAGDSIVLRIVDARTGVLRDAGVIRKSPSMTEIASKIADFVRLSRETAAKAQPRTYLAIGAFEDLSLNNRQADFPTQLRGYLTAAYQGSGVTLLEREELEALLREVRLDLAGLTEGSNTNAPQPMQSAFWLVTGLYQSYETENLEVEILLDVRRVFDTTKRLKLRGLPIEPVGRLVKAAIDETMQNATELVAPTPTSEAHAEMWIGQDIANKLIWQGELGMNEFGSTMDQVEALAKRDSSVLRRERNLKQAIQAFETVLLLEPTNRHAKLLLAACLLDPTIQRREQARDYYREIIEAGIADQWTDKAREALIESFDRHNPAEAVAWFGAVANQVRDGSAAEFYRQQAAAAEAIMPNTEGDEAKRKARAEARLFEQIDSFKAHELLGVPGTNLAFGDHAGYRMGMYEFVSAFPKEPAKAAQRLFELLPKMKERAPELEPYLLATVMSFQVDTNTPATEQFCRSLEFCAQHPQQVFMPEKYWDFMGWQVCEWGFETTNYDLAIKVLETKRLAATQGYTKFDEEENVELAFAYFGTRRWKQALDIFEQFSNQSTKAPWFNGPWGQPWCIIRTDRMAALCRERLGLKQTVDPRQFEMGPNCVCTHRTSAFAADDDGLWLAIGGELLRVDLGLKTNKVVALPIGADVAINCICVGQNSIWIGTDGAGIVECPKNGFECRWLTERDGLLMEQVCNLCETGDQLWIGYGGHSGGGLGKMDLGSRKLRSFMTSLIDNRPQPAPAGAVTSLVLDNSGDLLMYAGASVQRLHIAGETWDTVPRREGDLIYGFAADREWIVESVEVVQREVEIEERNAANQLQTTNVVVSDDELSLLLDDVRTNAHGRRVTGYKVGSVKPKPALEIRNSNEDGWHMLLDPDAIPNHATALFIKGPEAWVGGEGFIARVDLKQRRVLNFCRISAAAVDRVQVGGGFLWAQFNQHLHRAKLP